MKVYLNKQYKCVKVEDNTFVANDSSNYIRYYFVTNANGDVIDKMDDTSVIYRNTEPSYVTVAFRRADGDVIQHLMASPKTDATGKSFFEYEITNTDGVLYKKGALEISAQFIEATLSETGGVKKVISQKVKAIAINTAHVLDNIGEEAEEYYSQYEQANNDAHAVLQTQITTNFNNIGTLQDLTTDAKEDLVKAINEVDAHADANKSAIGDLSTLTTDEKTTIVGAINEVDAHADANKAEIGNLSALTTDEKATLVGAINEVDNHADNATTLANNAVATANGAVATANEAKTTAQTAENNANSAVDKANDAVGKANEAIMKADAKATSIGFMTAKDAVTALNGYPRNQLKGGDTIWIVEDGTPDLWVTEVAQESVPYNYTTKDKFNQDLVDNKVLQIGYFKTAYQESDGKPVTIAWQNVVVKNWVASTEFADFPYEAKIELTDFVDYTTVPQVVFDIADTMSGNYAPICKSGDKCVYIYGKVQDEITLKTVITFAPNVNGASVTGGGYNNRGKWVASTTYAIDDLVYTDNGQFVCIEGITSTTSPEQDTQHWQATFVATGKTKNTLTISGQDNGTGVQKTFDGSAAVEVSFDENTMTAKEVDGVLKVGAKGTVPEALPQEASALKSGSLPTSGWTMLNENWEGSTLPASRSWQSVTYGNGKYVAVANNSSAGAYSTDGISWTEFSLPAYKKWYSVAYGNDKFVAVAFDSDKGAYSTDGITWTEFSLPANSSSWSNVVYGNGKYIAVASNSLVGAYSTDGITWTEMTLPASRYWQSITYGGGKYVMVAQNITYGSYSTDGINWSSFTLPASRSWKSVAYGGGKFVAVAMDIDKGAYSTDGINWTEMTLPTSDTWQSVTYGNGKFVAVARNNVARSAYSTDGINWKLISMPVQANWYSVTYGGGKYVTVAQSSTSSAYQKASKSTYAISDTSITANSDILMELTDEGGVKAHAIANGSITVIRDAIPTQAIPYTYKVKQTNASGQFTLVNHYVPSVPESPTSLPVTYKKASGELPITGWNTLDEGWKENTLPASADWRRVTYGNGKFVAVTDGTGRCAYSTDGISWNETSLPTSGRWFGVTYGDGKFVAVALSTDKGAYSTDGINWNEFTLPASQGWHSVTYGNGKFVAVAGSSTGAYSTDGINWTTMTLPTSQGWYGVTYGDGKFVAVAANSNKGAYSTDGITWTEMSMPENAAWFNVVYGNGKFVAITQGLTIAAYSANGTAWSKITLPIAASEGIAYGDGKFFVVPNNSNYGAYSTDGINWTQMSMPTSQSWRYVTYGNGKFVAVAQSANGAYWKAAADVTYTISDTFITANTSVKMYLTDAGGVKAQSKASGSITVIRDTVPTTAIPYEYEVEQTSTEGLFEVINAYVPDVPTKTSQLTNDSGFITAADIPSAGEWVDVAGETATLTQAGTYQVIASVNDMQSIVYWDGSTVAYGTKSTAPSVSTSGGTAYLFINCAYPYIDASGTLSVHLLTAGNSSGTWTETDTVQSGFKYRKIN